MDERVVMLNEKHWYPNHRLFALEMLDILKENNFNYLAIEAVDKNQDSVINNRGFPSFRSGYYTREPYFAHFIRKAKALGFKIVSYEDYETNNRELGQATNLKKILDNDSNAKMFVYAGVAHIIESDPSHKRMAEYFKELTKINPLTFSQDHLTAKTEEEIVLFPSGDLTKVVDLNASVDYFILNNLKPSLEKIFPNNVLKEIVLESKKFNNKNLFIRVYNKKEYDLIQKNAMPIFITALLSNETKIELKLPLGTYFVSILSDKNEILFDDFIIVK